MVLANRPCSNEACSSKSGMISYFTRGSRLILWTRVADVTESKSFSSPYLASVTRATWPSTTGFGSSSFVKYLVAQRRTNGHRYSSHLGILLMLSTRQPPDCSPIPTVKWPSQTPTRRSSRLANLEMLVPHAVHNSYSSTTSNLRSPVSYLLTKDCGRPKRSARSS